MGTEIGIIAGKILELLERRKGILVFGEIHSDLGMDRDMVLMGLGWLLHEGYVKMMEDPSNSPYQDGVKENPSTINIGAFDLIVGKDALTTNKRIKDLSGHITSVSGKIKVLMGGCGGIMDLQAIDHNINENRDIILMSLGYMVNKGLVHGFIPKKGSLIYTIPLEMADV